MYYNTYVTIKYVHLEWTTSNDKKKTQQLLQYYSNAKHEKPLC